MKLLLQAVVMGLYIRTRAVPPWVLILLCLSKRLHSIYLLRLFNDGVAMLVAYIAVWLLVSQRWRASMVAFSAAVSIKMNVLLMAPPVLLVMLKVGTHQVVCCLLMLNLEYIRLCGSSMDTCSPDICALCRQLACGTFWRAWDWGLPCSWSLERHSCCMTLGHTFPAPLNCQGRYLSGRTIGLCVS